MSQFKLIQIRFIWLAVGCGAVVAACGSGAGTPQATASLSTNLPPTAVATSAPTQPTSVQPEVTLVLETTSTPPPGKPALITAGGLHVRSGPGPEFDVVVSLVRCTTVYVLGEEGEWVRIEQGYVHGDYITYDMNYPCRDYTPQP